MTMQRSQKRLTGRSVAMIAGMLFLVVVGVNSVLIVTAFRSWTGLTTATPYEHGLRYNHTLQAARDQAALGWTGRIAYDGMRLSFELAARDGAAVDGAEVQAWLSRPVASGQDLNAILVSQGGGRYAVDVAAPASGQWDVRVDARVGDARWHATTRVMVP
ncbi:MAG: FixH family protein [Alphaproteobacteria bacterium]